MGSLRDFAVNFGTSGARGPVAGFTPLYCWTFVCAFLQLPTLATRTLLVGHDLRPSSPDIARYCMSAAEAVGVQCLYAGALPTPALALASTSMGLPGIMITGSHIPSDRNGIKAYRPHGEITKSDEKFMLEVEVEPSANISITAKCTEMPEFRETYARRYTECFNHDALANMRIGIYEHSTVSRDLLHRVLRGIGADTISLGRSETFVPVDTEAIRAEDVRLAREWAAEGFDAIISADGDGDRPLITDENGNWLRGDTLGILAAKALNARTVVTPITSNTAAEKCGAFEKVVRTRIGSPHVIAGMESADNPSPIVGYEANGGFLLGDDVILGRNLLPALPTRDALLPIILVLYTAHRRSVRLSELVAELPLRATFSVRLQNITTESSRQIIELLLRDGELARSILAPASGLISHIDQTDGVRVTFENEDIVHLRPSGNAPELRCYAESVLAAGAKELCESCLTRLEKLN